METKKIFMHETFVHGTWKKINKPYIVVSNDMDTNYEPRLINLESFTKDELLNSSDDAFNQYRLFDNLEDAESFLEKAESLTNILYRKCDCEEVCICDEIKENATGSIWN